MNIKNILLVIVIPALTACGFSRTSEPARFYTLTTPAVEQVRGPANPTNVVIENVSVPQSVDRPQMVVKYTDSNMVDVSEFDRWIESPSSAMNIAISENMNMYARNINAIPKQIATHRDNAKYVVSIDFVRFDTEVNGKITMSAWWTISNTNGDVLVQKKTTRVADTPNEKSDRPDYDAIVAAQSKMIADISYKIADAISELK